MLFHDTCRCQCFQNFALTTVYLFLMSLARSSMSTARHILTKISLKPHLNLTIHFVINFKNYRTCSNCSKKKVKVKIVNQQEKKEKPFQVKKKTSSD